ncbi:hypothetical protein [Furfurilactobacillus entadae]|uniref:hypothetical protein n=1 Tax=Furfurilactobacillus entadae TaxID=2922307 RepID=UPI0035EEA9DC
MAHKVLTALCYLSILFLPVIFPLIVWIVAAGQRDVTRDAARAFWSQLLPTIIAFGSFFWIVAVGFTSGATAGLGWLTLLLIGGLCLVSAILWFYNIIMGVMRLLA